MDAREWKASIDRIESTLFEIINLLKEESRRWATAPIFSTPRPVSVNAPPTLSTIAASPPPTSVPIRSSPLAFVSTVTPKQVNLATSSIPKPIPKVEYQFQHNMIFLPVVRKSTPQKAPTIANCLLGPPTVEWPYRTMNRNRTAPITGIAEKRDWRPPWRSVATALNVAVRLEWRPPWPVAEHLPVASMRTWIV
ncbi:hypothetical protein HanRHA438_Chr15g0711641 [Helianthus annuus]|nr:hypothetical protein HanIR_Chr15g0760521 [Helianthus annuus]KAJ0845261.1 hypothetical protein HanRHA438_Chr15g0711641 [Helianthus annuus]